MYYAFSKQSARIDEFRDEEELGTALGHDYSDGDDWGPEDLVLDPQGRIGKIGYNGQFYEYRFTQDKVTLGQLKDIASAVLRKNGWTEEAVRARVTQINEVGHLSAVACQYPLRVRLVHGVIFVCLLAFLAAWFIGWFLAPAWVLRAISGG